MTLVVAWLGVDQRGPCSAYIASDSRISWGNEASFDYARKVFACNNYPDIFGYCGEVLFPSIVMSQIVEMADCGLLFREEFSCEQKFYVVLEKLNSVFEKYPHEVKNITSDVLQIVHLSRENNGKEFSCYLIEWRRSLGWEYKVIDLPKNSDTLALMGTGSIEFDQNYKRYNKGLNVGTSRNVFHCFCDTLFNIADKTCGGAPQLVGLFRKPRSHAVKFGVLSNGKRYLFGAEVDDLNNFDNIQWRNDLFELCDGVTMKRKEGAIPQPDILKRY